ncbi:putative reverse transcriptase domain-containing protein [Tanacetum coccineum]|uniref:Reverse transcriptase domain-containing protein n=1 Tax=Tanacetum coccineum TaxID=301880 RepID=A0ABQ4Y4R2_9ASTR
MLLPSTTHRDDLLEAGTLLRKRDYFTAPNGRFEVGESLSAAAARQAGHTLAHIVDYGFIDIVDASIRAAESRAMTVVWEVNEKVTNLATTQRERIYFRSMASSYEREAVIARQAWVHSKSRIQAMKAQIRALQRDVDVLQRQRIRDEDKLTNHIQHEHDSGNGDDSHDSRTGGRRQAPTTRECAYSDFLKCQPLNFKGTKGVGNALTWWNSYVKIVSHEVAYRMTWKALKKMMTDKYCPRGEIKKLKIELWYLKVKGTDVLSYNQCFQELALMCSRMFLEESDEIEKYDAIEFATELMDQKIRTFADCQAENKRKIDDNSRNNQNQLSKGKMWQGPTLLGLGNRKCMEDLNLCALNATTITMGSVLPSAPTARGLAIWPMTVGVC